MSPDTDTINTPGELPEMSDFHSQYPTTFNRINDYHVYTINSNF